MAEKEEFELVPMSPIRRLEKRIEQLESTKGVDIKEFFRELVEIVRMNQQLVDQLAKADDALRIEISKLPGRIDDLIGNLNELLAFVKASATEETGVAPESFKPLIKKMDALIEGNKKIVTSNEAMLTALDELGRKLKPSLPRRTMLPPLKPK